MSKNQKTPVKAKLEDIQTDEVSLVPSGANRFPLLVVKSAKIEKGATEYTEFPKAPEDLAWDGTAAENRLRQWASSDGSGEKEKIDWGKYRTAFLHYNAEDPENFGSYKMPVVDVIDGEPKLVWSAVTAAFGAMQGARGGVDIPEADREGVMSRIKRHYGDFGKEWPLDIEETEKEETEKQPDGMPESAVENAPAQPQENVADLGTHEKLVKELLGLLAQAGKDIWTKAPNLDITDEEAFDEFKKKTWAIEDICWQLRGYRDVMSLASSAKEATEKGDAVSAMDSIAKMLKVFGETASIKQKREKSEQKTNVGKQEKAFEEGKISRLVEGLMMVSEALQGVNAASLSEMLQSLMGQGPEVEEILNPEENDSVKMGGENKTKLGKAGSELHQLKTQLADAQKRLAKFEEMESVRAGTIQRPNGLSNEIKPTQKGGKTVVVWEEDLAARKKQ